MGLMFAFLASCHIERWEVAEISTFDGTNMYAFVVFVVNRGLGGPIRREVIGGVTRRTELSPD